jgi:hypothetical protein
VVEETAPAGTEGEAMSRQRRAPTFRAVLFAVQLAIGLGIFAAALAILALTACASAPSPGVPAQSASSVKGWSTWSAGDFTGLRPAGGLVAWDFPSGDPAINHVDYVTRSHSGPVAGEISVTYRVAGVADLEPNTTGFKCPCGTAVVHLFLAVPNYDVYGTAANYPVQRWWSVATADLAPGEHTLVVPLDPAAWLDVNGRRGDTQLAGFKAAIANVGSRGVTFGASQGPAGHGVAAVAGAASLTLEALAP